MIVGNPSPFTESSNHAPNYLLGSPIVVPAESTIDAFGVISRKRARVVVALYTDAPMSLVAFTEPADVATSEERLRPIIHPTIAPGTYWLLAVFDRSASVGIDRTEPTSPVRYVRHELRRELPQVIESPTRYTGQRFNYYLVTE